MFLAHFEPEVTRFGPWKIPTCLEKGLFWDPKWVKNGSETRSSINYPGPFGRLKQVFLAHFEPVGMRFTPWKIPNCLEKHGFATKNGSKIGQKRASPKVTLHHSGFSKKTVFCPFCTRVYAFWPVENPNMP